MIGGQSIEFHQHHAHGGVGHDGDHVFRALPATAAQRRFNACAHRVALAQIVFHQVGNHAARRQFARRRSFQAVSLVGEAPGEHAVRRDFAGQLRLGCV